MSEPEDVLEPEVLEPESPGGAPAVAGDVLPDTLYLMPIPNRPFFPGQVQPVGIDPQEWVVFVHFKSDFLSSQPIHFLFLFDCLV